jgi:hypothetical protein
MPNDVADWTRVNQEQIVGRAPLFTPLGDVTSPSLAPDSVVETFFGGNLVDHAGVVASFKAAAGQVIARVGALGAFLVGPNTTITPAFGQATVAGHCLAAWVTAGQSAISSTSPGWVEIFNAGINNNASVWIKPNCGNGEAAPTFTAAGATRPMMAQLGEFSGVATVSPQENSGAVQSPPIGYPMAIKAAAADVVTGDLLLCATVWRTSAAGTASFSDAYGNQATPVLAGNSGASSLIAHSNFTYAIIPALVGAQPLGVRSWDYDITGTSAPAAGAQATVTLAASPGKTYRAAFLDAALVNTGVAAGRVTTALLDGAAVIFTGGLGAQAATGAMGLYAASGLGYKGTVGNSMTWRQSAGVANYVESVNIGAYLQ